MPFTFGLDLCCEAEGGDGDDGEFERDEDSSSPGSIPWTEVVVSNVRVHSETTRGGGGKRGGGGGGKEGGRGEGGTHSCSRWSPLSLIVLTESKHREAM